MSVNQRTGSVFAYDVNAIINTLENPGSYWVYKAGLKAIADPQKSTDLVDLPIDPSTLVGAAGEIIT